MSHSKDGIGNSGESCTLVLISQCEGGCLLLVRSSRVFVTSPTAIREPHRLPTCVLGNRNYRFRTRTLQMYIYHRIIVWAYGNVGGQRLYFNSDTTSMVSQCYYHLLLWKNPSFRSICLLDIANNEASSLVPWISKNSCSQASFS